MDRGSWHGIEGSDQDHPQEKEIQKAKWLSEEALQIAEKRKKAKGNGEKQRYIQLNADSNESQGEAKQRKKAFLNDQCKEIEENNTIEKIRDIFKKIGNIKGKFHQKLGTIRDRNGKDLVEAEEIKKRWQ